MKKVLIVASWYPSADRPLNGIFVQEQAAALAKAYDVMVFSPRLLSWSETIGKNLWPRAAFTIQENLPVYRQEFWAPPKIPFRLRAYLYLTLCRHGLQKIVANWGKPDILHAHVVLVSGWVAAQLGAAHKIPVVLTEHSGPFTMHLGSPWKQDAVRRTINQAKRVIAVSPALVQQIQKCQAGAAITLLPNLVRTALFTIAEPQGRRDHAKVQFLCVAMLTPIKGITYLLQAAKLLIQHGITNFELLIGGDGAARTDLEQEAAALEISDNCRFLGLLRRSAVRDHMQQCDVFILPSLVETFGIVCAEAMACGKPVIATLCGGPEYVVTPETGLLVGVADPAALAAAMQKFICGEVAFDPQIIRHSVVERFGEAAFLRNLTTVYEEVWTEA